MAQDSNILGEKLNALLETLEMKKDDLERMIKKNQIQAQSYFSNGPDDEWYWASYYGSISIKDF
jgi:hypothetical protein